MGDDKGEETTIFSSNGSSGREKEEDEYNGVQLEVKIDGECDEEINEVLNGSRKRSLRDSTTLF